MKCNYKNRNSEGDKGFQALESYTKSLMPAVRAIETTMKPQYIVDSTTLMRTWLLTSSVRCTTSLPTCGPAGWTTKIPA